MTNFGSVLFVVQAVCIALLLTKTSHACTSFRLPHHLTSHAVLQANATVPIWGYASPTSNVTVDILGRTFLAVANQQGNWAITFISPPASTVQHDMRVRCQNGDMHGQLLLTDIVFGDVWLCSGQSNMQFPLNKASTAATTVVAAQHSNIRLFAVAASSSRTPQYDLPTSPTLQWTPANTTTLVGLTEHAEFSFSAVCWFFGKALYKQVRYPIGLIQAAVESTSVLEWSSPDVLQSCNRTSTKISHGNHTTTGTGKTRTWRDHKQSKDALATDHKSQRPGARWNAMIHPLLSMPIKGAIWWQGEEDTLAPSRTDAYSCMFPEMIRDWRLKWNERAQLYSNLTSSPAKSSFPFGFVQLQPLELKTTQPIPTPVAKLRWAQTANYGYVPNPRMPNTFMAVAADLGDPESEMHPRFKEQVATRLSLGALHYYYSEHNKNPTQPLRDTSPKLVNTGSYWTGPLVSSVTLTSSIMKLSSTTVLQVPANSSLPGENITSFETEIYRNITLVVHLRNVPDPNQTDDDKGIIIRHKTGFEVCIVAGQCSNLLQGPPVWIPAGISGHGRDWIQLKVSGKRIIEEGGGKNPPFVFGVRYQWRVNPCNPQQGILHCSVYSATKPRLPLPPFVTLNVSRQASSRSQLVLHVGSTSGYESWDMWDVLAIVGVCVVVVVLAWLVHIIAKSRPHGDDIEMM